MLDCNLKENDMSIQGNNKRNVKNIVIHNAQECLQDEDTRTIEEIAVQNTNESLESRTPSSNAHSDLLESWLVIRCIFCFILFAFFILIMIFLIKYRLLEFSFIPDTLVSRIKFDHLGNISNIVITNFLK